MKKKLGGLQKVFRDKIVTKNVKIRLLRKSAKIWHFLKKLISSKHTNEFKTANNYWTYNEVKYVFSVFLKSYLFSRKLIFCSKKKAIFARIFCKNVLKKPTFCLLISRIFCQFKPIWWKILNKLACAEHVLVS